MSLTATFLQRASEDINEPASFRGLPIITETPKGGVREGDYPDGTHWKKTMLCDYGYIQHTSGAGDEEPVDVYVGDDESAEYAYAVEQVDDEGEFDEYKVMLGFPDLQSAEDCYTQMWGDKNLGELWEIPLHQLFDGVAESQAKTASVPKVIMQFLDSYDFEFYEKVADEVHEYMEDMLRAANIRGLVTSRAKRVRSLRDKLMKRHNQNAYEDMEAIKKDIKDLSGVRVALYFPQDQEKVGQIISANFEQARAPKVFPRDAGPEDGQGYCAVHYTVWWEGTVVEIQVASILMHAFSEVNHDLSYKPQLGALSNAELQIIDTLGALVGAGEASIEELQGEIERRTGTPLQLEVMGALRQKFAAARYHLVAAEDIEFPAKKSRYQKLCDRYGVTADEMDDKLKAI